MRSAQNQRAPIYWALKMNDGSGFLFAAQCWCAPWIFPSREAARKAAFEAKSHGQYCRPVRIAIDVKFWEVADGRH